MAQGSRLSAVVEHVSPRSEWFGPDVAVLDASGLQRVWGGADELVDVIRREAAAQGVVVAVAVAPSRVAALLFVLGTRQCRVVRDDECQRALGTLPLTLLETLVEVCGVAGGVPARPVSRRPSGRSGHYRLAPSPEVPSSSRSSDRGGAAWSAPLRPLTQGPPSRLASTRTRRSQSNTRSSAPPLCAIDPVQASDLIATIRRWGLKTLGDFSALPLAEVRARLGAVGVRLHGLARGEDDRPLVPFVAAPVFEATLVLEWPIEGFEPLSFVLGRLFDDVCLRLEQHDRGGVRVRLRLRLVSKTWHERLLELPAPMRDAKVLRTLVLLDLERHPPSAGIDAITVSIDPAPGRIVQHSLLERAVPPPEQISTLVARLTSLVGEGRCGAPALVDSHRPGRLAMAPFAPSVRVADRFEGPVVMVAVVRRFRPPVAIRVEVVHGCPSRVWGGSVAGIGGLVRQWSGPWRGSGAWWPEPGHAHAVEPMARAWGADEWDVELSDGGVYRVSQSKHDGQWWLEGVLD